MVLYADATAIIASGASVRTAYDMGELVAQWIERSTSLREIVLLVGLKSQRRPFLPAGGPVTSVIKNGVTLRCLRVATVPVPYAEIATNRIREGILRTQQHLYIYTEWCIPESL